MKVGDDGSSGERSIDSISKITGFFVGAANKLDRSEYKSPAFPLLLGREGKVRDLFTRLKGTIASGYYGTVDTGVFTRTVVSVGKHQQSRHLGDFIPAPSREGPSSDRKDWCYQKRYLFGLNDLGQLLRSRKIDEWTCHDTEFVGHDCMVAHASPRLYARLKNVAVSPCISPKSSLGLLTALGRTNMENRAPRLLPYLPRHAYIRHCRAKRMNKRQA